MGESPEHNGQGCSLDMNSRSINRPAAGLMFGQEAPAAFKVVRDSADFWTTTIYYRAAA